MRLSAGVIEARLHLNIPLKFRAKFRAKYRAAFRLLTPTIELIIEEKWGRMRINIYRVNGNSPGLTASAEGPEVRAERLG
jgi:hypothetical protein